MRTDRDLTVITSIQEAFINATVEAMVADKAHSARQRVACALHRAKPQKVRSVDTKLSFRTFKKLNSLGVL